MLGLWVSQPSVTLAVLPTNYVPTSMKPVRFLVLVLTIFFALLPGFAAAHLDAGEDVVVGKYIIDFGYAPAKPLAGERIDFSLNVLDAATKKPVNPRYAWVRMHTGTSTVFAGTLSPQNANFAFTQTLPALSGEYYITTEFFGPGAAPLVTHTSHFMVAAPVAAAVAKGPAGSNSGIGIWLMFFGALCLSALVWREEVKK